MKKTSGNSGQTLKVLALILSLGALPLACLVTGCTTNSGYKQSSGVYVDDNSLTANVRKALEGDTLYKYSDVNVVTYKGVVQLNGFVALRDQRSRAGDLAKRAEGVNEVHNNITVKD